MVYIFSDLKAPGDKQAIKFKDFIEKAKQIKLNGANAAPDSMYEVGRLKYFRAKCPSLGEFENRDHFANLKKRFVKSIATINSDFDEILFDKKLDNRLEVWAEENPEYGNEGHFGAPGVDAPAKAFAAFLSLLFEDGYLSGEDLNDGEIIAIQREPQKSNRGNSSDEYGGVSLDSTVDNFKGEEYVRKIFNELFLNRNVIVEGVAGSGKSHLLESLRRAYCKQEENFKVTYWVAPGESKKDSEEEIKRKEREVENKRNEGFSPLYGENGSQLEVVVFHPSTSYEEFVSGIRPNFMKKEGFVSQEGVFVDMCNRAAANPDKKFLLFIDEINRANTSRVFGDLMLVLEKTKRVKFSSTSDNPEQGEVDPIYLSDEERFGALYKSAVTTPDGDYVRLQTPIYKTVEGEAEPLEFNKLVVPSNLHVLGTMNTTDRSVGTIDLALRRRFHWVTQHPYTAKELKTAMEKAGETYPEKVATWYSCTNATLLTEVGPDARLGHAYFFGKDGDEDAIAEALITQLLEIIFTFNIKEDVLEKIGLPELEAYKNMKLDYEGKGLGRRPVVKKFDDKGKSSVIDGGSDSENEGSESATSEDEQGNQ